MGAITTDELEGVWVLTATSELTVIDVAVSLAFDDGRTLTGGADCPFGGRWELDGDRLRTSEVSPAFGPCEVEDEAIDVIAASPTVDRLDGRPGSLELRTASAFVAFERVDRIGRMPGPEELVGEWTTDNGTQVEFDADGTVVLGPQDCQVEREWELEGVEDVAGRQLEGVAVVVAGLLGARVFSVHPSWA